MTNPPTQRLRFRWTKRSDGHVAVYLKQGSTEIDLSVWEVEDGTWSADAQQIGPDVPSRYQREEREGFATMREAKRWAESQVPA